MARTLISSGSAWEEKYGYSRAVVDDDWVFVSGTTGMDYAKGTVSEDVGAQAEQCLANIAAALEKAGAGLADVVRVVVYYVRAVDFEKIGAVLGRRFKTVRPASTAIMIAGLVDTRLKVEIEVTARKRKA